MSVAETLIAAKQELQTHGWGKLTLRRPNGNLCALGAIASALGLLQGGNPTFDTWKNDGPARSAMMALHDHLPCGIEQEESARVSNFNDHDSTTLQDVYNLFDKALADLGAL